jgi:hypothetical protein
LTLPPPLQPAMAHEHSGACGGPDSRDRAHDPRSTFIQNTLMRGKTGYFAASI